MPEYDRSQFDPPAPIARVTLRNPNNGVELANHELLMDTGADGTLLPRSAVERLGVQLVSDVNYESIAFDGTRSSAPVADLDMIFLNRRYRGRYLLTDAEQGVLGRDVLNHLRLLLDGPGQEWSEHSA